MKDRILVIDDDAIIRRLLGRLLAGRGFEVVVAADGEEGLAALEEADPEVVICDLCLPGIAGTEVVRRIRAQERWAATPVLVLTGEGDEESRGEALSCGADLYLTKPFSSYEIFEALEQLRSSGRTGTAAA